VIRIGSMFAGIGGFELGVEYALRRYGYPCETVWQIEQNQYCQRILHKHWPHAEIFDDVRECGAHNLPSCDVLLAGFPCQGISQSGMGLGLEDERSGLFYEVVRFLREMRPAILCLENTPAIISRGLDSILWELAQLGYSARWGGLRASDMGAPHRRARWWLIGWTHDTDRPLWIPCPCCENFWCVRHQQHAHDCECPSIDLMDYDPYSEGGERVADTHRQHLEEWEDERGHSWPEQPPTPGAGGETPGRETQSRVDGVSHGLPSRVDLSRHRWPAPPGQPRHTWEPPQTHTRQPEDKPRLMALGNSIVPQCAAQLGAWIAEELLT
jgi:site-specific DNA-cytosine methylase